MPKLHYSDRFYEDFLDVRLQSKRDEIVRSIDRLSDFPGIGSANLSAYIVDTYGDHVRKLVVNPFLVIYEHDWDTDVVNILGLVHQKLAY